LYLYRNTLPGRWWLPNLVAAAPVKPPPKCTSCSLVANSPLLPPCRFCVIVGLEGCPELPPVSIATLCWSTFRPASSISEFQSLPYVHLVSSFDDIDPEPVFPVRRICLGGDFIKFIANVFISICCFNSPAISFICELIPLMSFIILIPCTSPCFHDREIVTY
jgi:hypothetical protein